MKKECGFTLIELLVVVLIIGILAAVALPQYERAVEKSRAVEAFTLLSSLQKAMEVYTLANGSCASSLDELDIQIPENTYYNYVMSGCGLFARHPTKNLFFEFHPNISTWKGSQFCSAPVSDDELNNLCKSLGPSVVDHVNANRNYYKLN